MNFNKAFILGNVTRDPEMRSMPSGQQVASFGIATNRFYTDPQGQKKQDAEFHNIVCFGKLADIASRFITKGSLIFIEGRIKTSSWQNAQGAKQYKTEIIAETLQLGPRPQGSPAQAAGANSSYAPKNTISTKVEEIPIIEENAPVNFNTEEPHLTHSEEKSSDEIDVKDIPF